MCEHILVCLHDRVFLEYTYHVFLVDLAQILKILYKLRVKRP